MKPQQHDAHVKRWWAFTIVRNVRVLSRRDVIEYDLGMYYPLERMGDINGDFYMVRAR